MIRRRFPLAAAVAALLLCGCATSTLRITPAEPGRLPNDGRYVAYSLEGMNSGVYLFYFIPLWSGSTSHPNENRLEVFCHRINDKAIYRMFDGADTRLRTHGVADVFVETRSTGIWTLWIVWKRSVHGRGVLVSRKPVGRKKRFK